MECQRAHIGLYANRDVSNLSLCVYVYVYDTHSTLDCICVKCLLIGLGLGEQWTYGITKSVS